MNVEIGAEAALFPEKEYISGIFVAVYCRSKTVMEELKKEKFSILEWLGNSPDLNTIENILTLFSWIASKWTLILL